jgi:hypothetical protein
MSQNSLSCDCSLFSRPQDSSVAPTWQQILAAIQQLLEPKYSVHWKLDPASEIILIYWDLLSPGRMGPVLFASRIPGCFNFLALPRQTLSSPGLLLVAISFQVTAADCPKTP